MPPEDAAERAAGGENHTTVCFSRDKRNRDGLGLRTYVSTQKVTASVYARKVQKRELQKEQFSTPGPGCPNSNCFIRTIN